MCSDWSTCPNAFSHNTFHIYHHNGHHYIDRIDGRRWFCPKIVIQAEVLVGKFLNLVKSLRWQWKSTILVDSVRHSLFHDRRKLLALYISLYQSIIFIIILFISKPFILCRHRPLKGRQKEEMQNIVKEFIKKQDYEKTISRIIEGDWARSFFLTKTKAQTQQTKEHVSDGNCNERVSKHWVCRNKK